MCVPAGFPVGPEQQFWHPPQQTLLWGLAQKSPGVLNTPENARPPAQKRKGKKKTLSHCSWKQGQVASCLCLRWGQHVLAQWCPAGCWSDACCSPQPDQPAAESPVFWRPSPDLQLSRWAEGSRRTQSTHPGEQGMNRGSWIRKACLMHFSFLYFNQVPFGCWQMWEWRQSNYFVGEKQYSWSPCRKLWPFLASSWVNVAGQPSEQCPSH